MVIVLEGSRLKLSLNRSAIKAGVRVGSNFRKLFFVPMSLKCMKAMYESHV